MPSNRNRHGHFRIVRANRSAHLGAMTTWDWRKKRLTFEEVAGTDSWNTSRAAKVARAKKLIRNDDYPDDAITWSIARLLAQHLDR